MRQPDLSPGRIPTEWLKAIREAQTRSIAERPGADSPVSRAKNNVPATYEHAAELRTLIDRLKLERIAKGLSLRDVARITQQARSAISRLENGQYGNPTLNTLFRYARAVGCHVKLSEERLTDEQKAVKTAREPRKV